MFRLASHLSEGPAGLDNSLPGAVRIFWITGGDQVEVETVQAGQLGVDRAVAQPLHRAQVGTVTIGYPSAASPDWQATLTSDLLTEIQLRECVEAVLNKLGLPYCVFEGAEISPDSQLSEMAQALGSELLFQSIWQTEQIDRFCSKHVPSLVRSGCLDCVLSFAKRVLVQQVWDDAAGKTQCEAGK